MPDAPATSRPDVEAIKARFDSRPEYMKRVAFTGENLRTLIEYIEALEARQVKLVEATKVAIAMCLCCDGSGTAHTHPDETEVGCSPGSSAVPCPNCTDWREALAALGDGDG